MQRSLLQRQLEHLAADRWARTGLRTLLRAASLGAGLWCVGVGASLLLNWAVSIELLAALALGCVAVGAILVLRPRMSALEVARRLDRRFELHEQLATALELADDPPAASVAAMLQQQSGRTVVHVRRYVAARTTFPWSDLLLLLALVLLASGMLVLSGIGAPQFLQATRLPLPNLAAPIDETKAFPNEAYTPPPAAATNATNPDPAVQAVLDALANALRDQSLTHPVAAALDQGNPAQAARALRELADQANQLTPESRRAIADSLRQAANAIAQAAPELTQQLQASAQGLEAGGQSAAQALEDLAGALETFAAPAPSQAQSAAQQQPAPGQNAPGQSKNDQAGQGGSGAGNGTVPSTQRDQAIPSERLGVDGVPLQLASEGAGKNSTEGDGTHPTGTTGAGTEPGFESGTAPNSDRVQAGDDPLRIPPDLRDVVQGYFSP